MGLSLNNSRAVGQALIGVQSPFKRTPKYNLQNRQKTEKYLDYLLPKDGSLWLELLVGSYAFILLMVALSHGNWGLSFWLSLISGGYAYMTINGFKQSLAEAQAPPSSSPSQAIRLSSPATTHNPGQD